MITAAALVVTIVAVVVVVRGCSQSEEQTPSTVLVFDGKLLVLAILI